MGRGDAASHHVGESCTEGETDCLESAEAGDPTTAELVELSFSCARKSDEDNRVAEAAANQILQVGLFLRRCPSSGIAGGASCCCFC